MKMSDRLIAYRFRLECQNEILLQFLSDYRLRNSGKQLYFLLLALTYLHLNRLFFPEIDIFSRRSESYYLH